VTVWWAAEIQGKTDNMHTLSDEERQEGAVQSSDIKVPIYRLSYAPMAGMVVYISFVICRIICKKLNMFCCLCISKELGFEGHYLEDVAFISHKTLLNLSSE